MQYIPNHLQLRAVLQRPLQHQPLETARVVLLYKGTEGAALPHLLYHSIVAAQDEAVQQAEDGEKGLACNFHVIKCACSQVRLTT